MVKIYLKFYGCQSNLDDGRIVKGILSKKGYEFTNEIEKSDICIIGTCVVKNPTVNKIIYQLKEIYTNRKKKLIIAGCMPEAEAELCRKLFPKASLINTYHITEINHVIDSCLKNKRTEFLGKRKEKKLGLPKMSDKSEIITIQIAQGCTSNCSFCQSKLAKGYIQSYPPDSIIKELEYYLKKGIKRFNLSSTDNACYGSDINTNLIELLHELLTLKGNYKIRIGMMNPRDTLKILKDLIQIYKDKKIMKFLHIPVQSGSDKILKAMNRNYKIKDFKKIIKAFRKEIPKTTIATDVILGYPSETKADFQKTYDLIKKLKPEVLNISKFSSRPKTKASKLKQLKSEIIDKRSKIISKLYQEYRLNII